MRRPAAPRAAPRGAAARVALLLCLLAVPAAFAAADARALQAAASGDLAAGAVTTTITRALLASGDRRLTLVVPKASFGKYHDRRLLADDDGYSAHELRKLEVGVGIAIEMAKCVNYGDFSGCTDLDAASAVRVKLEDDGTAAKRPGRQDCTRDVCQLVKITVTITAPAAWVAGAAAFLNSKPPTYSVEGGNDDIYNYISYLPLVGESGFWLTDSGGGADRAVVTISDVPETGTDTFAYEFALNYPGSLVEAKDQADSVVAALAVAAKSTGVDVDGVEVVITAARRRLLASFKVTVTFTGSSGDVQTLAVFFASATNQAALLAALLAEDLNASLLVILSAPSSSNDNSWIGIPIGCSLGVLFLACLFAAFHIYARKSKAAEGKGEPEAPNTCCAVSYSNVKAEATVYKGKIVAHVQTPQLNVM